MGHGGTEEIPSHQHVLLTAHNEMIPSFMCKAYHHCPCLVSTIQPLFIPDVRVSSKYDMLVVTWMRFRHMRPPRYLQHTAQTRAETKLTTVNYKLAHPQFLRPGRCWPRISISIDTLITVVKIVLDKMDTFLRLPAAGSLAWPQVGSYTAAVVTTPATITG